MKNYKKYLFLAMFFCLFAYLFFFFQNNFESPERKAILQETDFYELRKAGRELISKAEWEEYVTIADGKRGQKLNIPKDAKIPDIILELQQKLSDYVMDIIFISKDGVQISFRTPHESVIFGVIVLSENYNYIPRSIGAKELIQGLWYIDDGFTEFRPGFEKIVDKMIENNRGNIKRPVGN